MAVDGERVERWLDEHWDLDRTVGEWWADLAASGMAFPTWPRAWGGSGFSAADHDELETLFVRRGAIGAPSGIGPSMGGPVLLAHGNDDQRARHLPALTTGREAWCQLFSEPGAGSDLASVATVAERDGDEWSVTGQKVWTSGAAHARRAILLARTDRTASKHAGLDFFVLDLAQDGVDVRPLRQMTGESHFNEVFLDRARVADADRIGEAGHGWAVATTTLAHERNRRAGIAGTPHALGAGMDRERFLSMRLGDALADPAMRPRLTPGFDRRDPGHVGPTSPMRLITDRDRAGDLVLRDAVARYATRTTLTDLTERRIRARIEAAGSPGPASSVLKLARSDASRRNRDLGPAILGAHGMLAGADAPLEGRVTEATLHCPAASIAGGTDEIQRNIIGERVLGLPREPRTEAER